MTPHEYIRLNHSLKLAAASGHLQALVLRQALIGDLAAETVDDDALGAVVSRVVDPLVARLLAAEVGTLRTEAGALLLSFVKTLVDLECNARELHREMARLVTDAHERVTQN